MPCRGEAAVGDVGGEEKVREGEGRTRGIGEEVGERGGGGGSEPERRPSRFALLRMWRRNGASLCAVLGGRRPARRRAPRRRRPRAGWLTRGKFSGKKATTWAPRCCSVQVDGKPER
jgi:hypothetical protein